MRPGTFYFSERVSFGASGYLQRVALSPLRSRGRETSLSSFRGTRFHAAGRSGDTGTGAGSVSLRARARRDRACAESPLPGCTGSGEARAHGNGAWHAANVRGFRRGETGGTHFWQAERAQGAGVGGRHNQRASGLATPGSRDRAAPCDEPLAGPRGGSGQAVRRKGRRLGRVGCSAAIAGCGGVVGQRGRTGSAARDRRSSDGGTRKSRIVPDGPGRATEYRSRRWGALQRLRVNTDDLTEIVQQNRNARESEVPRAQGIVNEHVTKFLSWQASVELVGLVYAL